MNAGAEPTLLEPELIIPATVPEIRPMTDTEQQSAGCAIGAATALGTTLAIGPSEIIMLIVGGLVVPSSSSVLLLTLTSTMASLACAAGATVTPLVKHVWNLATHDEAIAAQIKPPPPEAMKAVLSPADDSQSLADVLAQGIAPPEDTHGFSDSLKQGIGCVSAGTGSAAYAAYAGASETVMVAAGGLLIPSAASTLWLGLMSTLVAGTCSLGAVATPVLLWAVEQKDNISANLAYQTQTFIDTLQGASATTNHPALPDGNAVASAGSHK